MPVVLDLTVTPLMLGDVALDPLHVTGQSASSLWTFNFDSPALKGAANIYDSEQPIDLHLDYLRLPKTPEPPVGQKSLPASESADVQTPKGMAQWDLSAIGPVNINVEVFSVGAQNWGAWKFKLRPVDGGLAAYDLYANIAGLQLSGGDGRGAHLIWLEQENGHSTHFSGKAQAKNISPAIESIQGEKMLTSSQATMDVQLQWAGAPDDIAIEKLLGVVTLDLRRGRFIRGATAAENPLVKLVGLLNFDTLARRLRLDFSDLNPEGMAYESVTGELLFNDQTIVIKTPILVDTPSSQLQLVGDIDLANETLDTKLVATLPVAGNLTVAAALTGGIPVAMGVYVLGKIFKNQVDKASSIRYDVEGSWEDPDVKFDKVFDDTVSDFKPQSRQAESSAVN